MTRDLEDVIMKSSDTKKNATIELDRVVGRSRLPSFEDQPNLPYVRAVVKELHRFSPITSFAIPHASTEEIVYRENTIPNSTIILPCLDNIHRDPARYDDPDIFQPERFLGDDLEAIVSARLRDYWKRDHANYGFGRRMCPGVSLFPYHELFR
jgi:cytochrome P450